MSEVFSSSVLEAINRATTYNSDYVDPSTLKVIVIDGETRNMTIPEGENLFGARGDKNVERKYFQCPKIVGDNIDLSQHLIYVNYVFTDIDSPTNLPETKIGMYHCEDVAVEGDNITFSWLLSGNVLHNPGFIAFKVCAKEKESDPTTVFNTTPAIGIVLYTIPDGSEIIPEEYPDIITQLLADMDATKEEVAAQIARIDAIKDQIEGAVEGTLINDNTESNIFTYSSQKINTELRKKATYYDSVASMKADSSLKDGSIVVTLGYYSENDGGGATYLIRAKQSSDEDDGGSIHELNGGQLVAELIIEEYVTPEMFGAKGDGIIDDTTYIQQSIDFVVKNHLILFFNKKYKISQPLVIRGSNFVIFGLNSRIEYDGSDFAVMITGATDCDIFLGNINALNGSCVKFYSSSLNDYVQYINMKFRTFKSKYKCIVFDPVENGWTTEVRISDGMLNAGNYGIFADSKGKDRINGIKIYNIGIEGVSTGFYLANGCQSWDIINPRYAEAYDRLFETVGFVNNINFIGSNFFYYEDCLFSEKSQNFSIKAPLTMGGGVVVSPNGGIINYGIVSPNTFDIGYINLSDRGDFVDLGTFIPINRRCPRYIYAGNNVKILRLSKEMGRTYGLNEFYIKFYSESPHLFKVEDSNGKEIYNNSEESHIKLKFSWFNEIGWKYEITDLNF